MRVDAADDTAVENPLTCGIDVLLCIKAPQSQLWKTCSSRIQNLHDINPCIRHDTKISALFHRFTPACQHLCSAELHQWHWERQWHPQCRNKSSVVLRNLMESSQDLNVPSKVFFSHLSGTSDSTTSQQRMLIGTMIGQSEVIDWVDVQ